MNDNIFAELQMLTLTDTSIVETRQILTELTEFMCAQPWQEEQLLGMEELRCIQPETFKRFKCFMVPDDLPVTAIPEKFRHEAYGFASGSHLVYSGRFVLPIMDVKGMVAGFVGYDKFEKPKYLDSKNHGYKAKVTTLFGMQEMEKFYRDGYIFIPEGSMCKLYLSQNNLNSASLLGSYISPYVAAILNRFGENCFIVPDNDATGDHLKRTAKKLIPKARVLQMNSAKDIDDARQLNPNLIAELREYINRPYFNYRF